MPTLQDIFEQRPFQAVELTGALRNVTYVPDLLGGFGEALFPTVRVGTRQVAIGKRDDVLALIPVSPVGAPPVELETAGQNFRPFSTKRLAKGSTLYAEQFTGLLSVPMADAVVTIQQELAQRGVAIRTDHELTQEHMRLGAVLGKVVDADGVTILDDFFQAWNITQPALVYFDLQAGTPAGSETPNLRAKCKQIIDAARKASKGAWIVGRTRMHALAGEEFFDLLVEHPQVVRTYLNNPQASALREQNPDMIDLFGIVWHRWLEDGLAGADGPFYIPADEARFFPVGAREAFQRVMGPAEFMPWIGQPGQDLYALTIPDRDRGAWMRVEAYSYPLFICLRPEMLQRAHAGADPG